MRLTTLLKGLPEYKIVHFKEVEISDIAADSRKVQPENVFVCLEGGKYNGHLFAPEAIRNGAAAIVCERPLDLPTDCVQVIVPDTRLAWALMCANYFGNPARKLKVIGVMGTNGKTSTALLIAGILQEAGFHVGSIGTNGIESASFREENPLTTPDPYDLHRILGRFVEDGVHYVVMEISAHAAQLHKTEGISCEACVFTNFSQDHLDYFGTMESYREAKGDYLLSGAAGIRVVNGDDSLGRDVAKRRPRSTITYGIKTPTDSFATCIEESKTGFTFWWNFQDIPTFVHSGLHGIFNVYNVLAAVTVCRVLGIKESAITQGIDKTQRIAGRNETFSLPNGAKAVVDFAHTPDGFRNILGLLRKTAKNCRLIVVFGCGGNRDASKRAPMGQIASRFADFVYLTDDNPREEPSMKIIEEIRSGVSVPYAVCPDRSLAIALAVRQAQKGDVVAILGKGNETEKIVGTKHIPYSDLAEVRRLKRILSKQKSE